MTRKVTRGGPFKPAFWLEWAQSHFGNSILHESL
jgi:hypothetical protein